MIDYLLSIISMVTYTMIIMLNYFYLIVTDQFFKIQQKTKWRNAILRSQNIINEKFFVQQVSKNETLDHAKNIACKSYNVFKNNVQPINYYQLELIFTMHYTIITHLVCADLFISIDSLILFPFVPIEIFPKRISLIQLLYYLYFVSILKYAALITYTCFKIIPLKFVFIFLHAGTFFGMKPCGIILFVYELFISESKLQVYGILQDVLTKLGMQWLVCVILMPGTGKSTVYKYLTDIIVNVLYVKNWPTIKCHVNDGSSATKLSRNWEK